MSTRSCPLCGHTILKVARFCGACGQPVPAELPAGVAASVPILARESAPPILLHASPADDYNDFTRPNWKPDPQTLAAASGLLEPDLTPLGPPVELDSTLSDTNARGRALAMMADGRISALPPSPLGAQLPSGATEAHPWAGAPAPAQAPPAPMAAPIPAPVPAAVPAPILALPPPAMSPPEPVVGGRQRTMLGVAMPGIAPPAPAPAAPPRNAFGTLLGVATPLTPTPPPAAPAPAPPGAPPPHGGRVAAHGTLLGVAGPPPREPSGVSGSEPPEKIPSILPLPAPPQLEELPPAPEIVPKRGFPVAPVVGLGALLLAAGGVVLFFALNSGPPITAQGRVDEKGKEALAVRCASCPDGTKLSLAGHGGASEVKGGEAVVPLAAPLALGPNDLALTVDRPGSGRDETVKLRVPVSYRVRSDPAALGADPPTITVLVEALPGTTVEVEGKPVALTGGKGQVDFPVGAEAVGAAETAKALERTIGFKVTLPDSPDHRPTQAAGALAVRTRIVPLHLDAPGPSAVVQTATCHVTGQTLVGASISVNGKETPLGARGEFAAEVPCAELTRHKIDLVARSAGMASRRAHIHVTRVASLEAEAKVWETRGPAHDALGEGATGDATPVAFEALTSPTSVGKPALVEGPVLDVRVVNGLAVVLLDNERKCKSAPGKQDCLVRLLYGGAEPLQKGQRVRGFGFVSRALTADGRTLPELHAAFVLPGRAN